MTPQAEREAIARIVEPHIWESRDVAFSGAPFLPWDEDLDRSMTSASLAKADLILAAAPTPPQTPDGKGEGK